MKGEGSSKMSAAAPLFHNYLHTNWDYGALKIF